MSRATHLRYQQTHIERFHSIITTWLASIEGDRWEGRVPELREQINRATAKVPAKTYVPSGSALTKTMLSAGHVIAAAGWKMEFRRTTRARVVVFSRVAKASKPRRNAPAPAPAAIPPLADPEPGPGSPAA